MAFMVLVPTRIWTRFKYFDIDRRFVMSEQIQISLDRDVYEQLQMLMSPPVSDINTVIRSLLFQDGHTSPAAIAVEAETQHFTYEQELERARMGIYTGGGGT
jgi:hypothetical protein